MKRNGIFLVIVGILSTGSRGWSSVLGKLDIPATASTVSSVGNTIAIILVGGILWIIAEIRANRPVFPVPASRDETSGSV